MHFLECTKIDLEIDEEKFEFYLIKDGRFSLLPVQFGTFGYPSIDTIMEKVENKLDSLGTFEAIAERAQEFPVSVDSKTRKIRVTVQLS